MDIKKSAYNKYFKEETKHSIKQIILSNYRFRNFAYRIKTSNVAFRISNIDRVTLSNT